jgi:hypothetical protein
MRRSRAANPVPFGLKLNRGVPQEAFKLADRVKRASRSPRGPEQAALRELINLGRTDAERTFSLFFRGRPRPLFLRPIRS